MNGRKRAVSPASTVSASDTSTPTNKRPRVAHTRVEAETREEDLENLLRAMQRSNKKDVIAGYHPPTLGGISTKRDGSKYQVAEFRCRVCNKVVAMPVLELRVQQLEMHGNKHPPVVNPAQRKLTTFSYFGAGELAAREILQGFALWCAADARPYIIVEDEFLRPLLSTTARQNLPDRTTISRAVKELYQFAVGPVSAALKLAKGKMHASLDAWQSPNGYDVLGVVLYYRIKVDGKFERKSLTLDLVAMPEGHSAKSMEKLLWGIFDKFSLAEKILTLTTDNASAMHKLMVDSVGYGDWRGEEGWIRCFCHILNLVVQCILKYLRSATTSASGLDDPFHVELDEEQLLEALQLDDEDAPEPSCADPDAATIEVEFRETRARIRNRQAEREAERDAARQTAQAGATAEERNAARSRLEDLDEVDGFEWRDEAAELRSARSTASMITLAHCTETLKKCSFWAAKCRYTPAAREWLVALSLENKNANTPHSIPRPVPTRWNSVYEMLKSVLNHKDELIAMGKDKKFKIAETNKLLERNVRVLEFLVPLLAPFLTYTHEFSAEGAPSLERVLPAFDELTGHLDAFLSDHTLPAPIHNAILLGHEKLNEYYTLSGESHAYEIAVVLHPSYGVRWMEAAKWPTEWIDAAIEKAQAWYSEHYQNAYQIKIIQARQNRGGSELQGIQPSGKSAFDRMLSEGTSTDVDLNNLLDRWARAERVVRDPRTNKPWDAFAYFSRMEHAGEHEHGIVEMGLDLFCAAASSVDAERAFSFGGLSVSSRRHRLSAASVCSGMALRGYAKAGLILPGLLHEGRRLRRQEKEAEAARVAAAAAAATPIDLADDDDDTD